MPRTVHPETLDGLAADHPAAMRARRELRRMHRVLGTHDIVLQALLDLTACRRYRGGDRSPLRVLELGAGDGSMMLAVAKAAADRLPRVELTLLDRVGLVTPETVAGYERLGWHATPQVIDAVDWAMADDDPLPGARQHGRWDVIISNHFLHHFEGAQLTLLLDAIAARSDRFFACEPRRARLSLIGSYLLGVFGASRVTREDTRLSVHAGFRDADMYEAWPLHTADWSLYEYAAGLVSHCFRAVRDTGRLTAAE